MAYDTIYFVILILVFYENGNTENGERRQAVMAMLIYYEESKRKLWACKGNVENWKK